MLTPPFSEDEQEQEEEEEEEAVLTRHEIHAELSRAKHNMEVLEEEYRMTKIAWIHHIWHTQLTFEQLATMVLPALVPSYAQIRAIRAKFTTKEDLWQHLVRLDKHYVTGEETDPNAIGRIASQWYAQERIYKKYATIINNDLRARGETFRYTFDTTLPKVEIGILASTTVYKKRVMSDYTFMKEYRDESVNRLVDIEVEWQI